MFSIRLILLTILTSTFCIAQQDSDYISTGVRINMYNQNKLTIYGGYSPTDKIQLTRIAPNFRINKYLSISPIYMYRKNYNNNTNSHQASITGALNIPITKNKKLNILSHSIYAYQFIENRDNASFLRQRIGLTYNSNITEIPFNFFIYDEIYYSIENKYISRNLISLGFNIRLSWLNPIFSYAHHINKNGPYKNVITTTFIIPLDNFGFFNKNNQK